MQKVSKNGNQSIKGLDLPLNRAQEKEKVKSYGLFQEENKWDDTWQRFLQTNGMTDD